MPTISTLVVDVKTETSMLRKGLALAGGAILAIGVAATKTALDYDDAFTKISAVSNASATDVEKWKGQVLDLAGKTAQAPKELADALYFLASAGLKPSQIMPVLAASAKASAVGLGETADVAHLTANVLNAYAGSGLKAAKVTDTLVAAVKAGSADTNEFGTAIGRILPIASTAGISFGSIAASLASLSNVGLDVNEGVTAMRGLIQALVSPTKEASGALDNVGLSAQTLLDSLQTKGLLGTLELLDTAIKKNTTGGADYMGTLRAIVPNVRALTGMLGLTTQQASSVKTVFDQVNNSTGAMNEAFKTTSESTGFKLRQALADLQVVAIKLGDLILPVLSMVVTFLMDNMVPAWDATVGWLKKVWNAVEPVAKVIADVLVPAFKSAWGSIEDHLLPGLKRIYEAVKPLLKILGIDLIAVFTIMVLQITIVTTALGYIIDAFSRVVNFVKDHVADPIIGAIEHVWGFLIKVKDWLWEHFADAWRHIGDVFSAVWNGMGTTARIVVNAVIGFLNQLVRGMNDVIQGENLLTPGHFGDIPKIPYIPTLAAGGIITKPTLAMLGEHGPEAVVPLGAGMGGVTVNIGTLYGGTPAEIARVLRDELLKLAKRNATTGL